MRERVIVSMLALGGFRQGTLVKLKYRHVEEDLEKGITPLHIHVEAAITKGKYHDYDTFIRKRSCNLSPRIPRNTPTQMAKSRQKQSPVTLL